MLDDLRVIWPDAPACDVDPGGRWLRFDGPDGATVYLQRYAWDDVSRPDFLVAWCHGDEPADQRRFGDFADAVDGVRALLAGRAIDPAVSRPAA